MLMLNESIQSKYTIYQFEDCYIRYNKNNRCLNVFAQEITTKPNLRCFEKLRPCVLRCAKNDHKREQFVSLCLAVCSRVRANFGSVKKLLKLRINHILLTINKLTSFMSLQCLYKRCIIVLNRFPS